MDHYEILLPTTKDLADLFARKRVTPETSQQEVMRLVQKEFDLLDEELEASSSDIKRALAMYNDIYKFLQSKKIKRADVLSGKVTKENIYAIVQKRFKMSESDMADWRTSSKHTLRTMLSP